MQARAECLSTTWPLSGQRVEPRACDEQAALVRRAQASDQMAFREIVERYQSKVFSIIRRIVRDHNDAEDIAQEVFVNAFQSIGAYRSNGSLLSWLYRIAVNESYEYLRRKKVRRLTYHADLPEEQCKALERRNAAAPVEGALADRDFAIKLLARVSEEERVLLLMKEVEGYSVEELSALTGLNQNSVKVKLFRARKKLFKAAQVHFRRAA